MAFRFGKNFFIEDYSNFVLSVRISSHYPLLSGITAEATDKAVNGCAVKTISQGGAIMRDGRIQVGDYLVSINNENMRKITNAQARAILRRASLPSTDLK